MKTVNFTETVEAKTKLDVLVEIGSVTIRPSTDNDIHIEATYRHMDISVERHEDTIMVRAEQEDDLFVKLSRLFRNDHPKAELIINVPAHCPIQTKVITGSLDVEGTAAAVTARVITGQLRLKKIAGPIYAKTTTGRLTYSGELTEENHRFETTTGEILLTLPESTNAELFAQTGTGSLKCHLPLAEQREERHLVGGKLRGVLGSGAGQVKAKIGTGSLVIRPLTFKQKEPANLLKEAELV
ncbi:MAG: DUF4097 family beta strand repeat protein [Ardenticatenaceae bacterium]|nr:DUF4097 family beta strand repeat protein [Ardenticatenaceae bacterium]